MASLLPIPSENEEKAKPFQRSNDPLSATLPNSSPLGGGQRASLASHNVENHMVRNSLHARVRVPERMALRREGPDTSDTVCVRQAIGHSRACCRRLRLYSMGLRPFGAEHWRGRLRLCKSLPGPIVDRCGHLKPALADGCPFDAIYGAFTGRAESHHVGRRIQTRARRGGRGHIGQSIRSATIALPGPCAEQQYR